MTTQFIWAFLNAFPLAAFQLVLALSVALYFGGKALLNGYHHILIDVSKPAVNQKIDFLSLPLVRGKFTLQSQVGQARYDLQLRYAREAMEQAESNIQSKHWTAAYRLIKSAKANLAEYNIGHLPPRDCPLPRDNN